MKKAAPVPPRLAAACPKGHTKNLVLRFIAEAPLILVQMDVGAYLAPVLPLADPDAVQDTETIEPGSDGGVWCPECEEWFDESDCVHPADDLGNPIVPGLGDETPEGEGDDEDEDL